MTNNSCEVLSTHVSTQPTHNYLGTCPPEQAPTNHEVSLQTPPHQLNQAENQREAVSVVLALFERMNSTSKILQKILFFCLEGKTVQDTTHYVNTCQQDNYSVFDAATLCNALIEAGALYRLYDDGSIASNNEVKPELIVEEGAEYYLPRQDEPTLWKTSETGKAALEEVVSSCKLVALWEEEAEFQGIYRAILQACLGEEGSTTNEITEALKDKVEFPENRKLASFLGKLEEADGLEWSQHAWKTTRQAESFLA
jgi:hypothetical protein